MGSLETYDVLGLVLARGGSKGIPKKNLQLVGGYPLLAFAIAAAHASAHIQRVVVSTDSDEIATVATKFGAEVPFVRPPELASDTAVDLDVIVHALDELQRQDGHAPEFLVHLRPTTPLRDPDLIDAAVQAIKAAPQATSLRSVHPLAEPPQKVLQVQNGYLVGLFPNDDRPEYYNLPRQAFPTAYCCNGHVDVVRASCIRCSGSLYGSRMLPFTTPITTEVDVREDLAYLEFQLRQGPNPVHTYLREHYPAETE